MGGVNFEADRQGSESKHNDFLLVLNLYFFICYQQQNGGKSQFFQLCTKMSPCNSYGQKCIKWRSRMFF